MSARSWKDKWAPVREIDSGGQGNSKVVLSKDGNDPNEYFLKILRHQGDMERRKRMHREVGAYSTLKHPGITKLVDSNSHQFADDSYKLYLVTEYVNGTTLYNFVQYNGALALNDAIDFVLALVDIVVYCHHEDCVHRDIKPINIMLRGGNIATPLLVDFGLSFNLDDESQLETELGQEIGNRFLRLPELCIDSSNKRDPRSDITSLCGILLYALTGLLPVSLLDENGKMPHQRPHIAAKLAMLPVDIEALLRIFDRGFQTNILHRWHCGEQFAHALHDISGRTTDYSMNKSSNEILREILEQGSSASMQLTLIRRRTLEAALKSAYNEFNVIISPLSNLVSRLQTGYSIDTKALTAQNILGAVRLDGNGEVHFIFHVEIVGSELLIYCTTGNTSTSLLRTDAMAPRFDPQYVESLRQFVAIHIRNLLSISG